MRTILLALLLALATLPHARADHGCGAREDAVSLAEVTLTRRTTTCHDATSGEGTFAESSSQRDTVGVAESSTGLGAAATLGRDDLRTGDATGNTTRERALVLLALSGDDLAVSVGGAHEGGRGPDGCMADTAVGATYHVGPTGTDGSNGFTIWDGSATLPCSPLSP